MTTKEKFAVWARGTSYVLSVLFLAQILAFAKFGFNPFRTLEANEIYGKMEMIGEAIAEIQDVQVALVQKRK